MAKRKYTGGTSAVPLLVDIDSDPNAELEEYYQFVENEGRKKKKKNRRGKTDPVSTNETSG